MFAGLDKQIGRTGFGGPPQVESCVVFASKFLSVPSRQMFWSAAEDVRLLKTLEFRPWCFLFAEVEAWVCAGRSTIEANSIETRKLAMHKILQRVAINSGDFKNRCFGDC